MGDSKTAGDSWVPSLARALEAPTGHPWFYTNAGVSGATVASAASSVHSILADIGVGAVVLMNWGANDVSSLPTKETWKANYLTIIDAVLGRNPDTRIYLVRPWRQNFDTECDTLAGWIGDIVAARPGVAFAGPDEREWLEGGDDGATMTTDGVHYSAAGQAEAVTQWLAVLT